MTSQIVHNSNSNAAFNNEIAGSNGSTIDREIGHGNDSGQPQEFNDSEKVHNNDSSVNNAASGANNLRGVDAGKRKKLKSRNIPTTTSTIYSKDHLDAWLETCLKDVSQEQLSSSSEFLDYNPTKVVTNSNINNSKQKQQATNNITNTNNQQEQNYGQHQKQQQLPMPSFSNTRSNTKGNAFMTGFPSAPFSQSFQRSMPNFMKPTSNTYSTNRFSPMFPTSSSGFYSHLNEGSQDFASLPPIVNLMGNYGGNSGTTNGAGSSELENNSTDVLDGSGSNRNISRGFRFSDPCLLNPSDNDSKLSGQNTPERRQNNITSDMENNKFFVALMEQINLLHETNSKIFRNLHETKVDIEALKHTPSWGMRHRRDSVSGLSAHSQPMMFGGGFGTQSPAPTYHSGAYTPGMMTDVVREVKEAARVREDALLNRVKALVEERQWSMSETNLRIMRDIEELKTQINFLRSERKETNKRLNHLEAENKYMRQLLASIYNKNRNQSAQIGRGSAMYETEMQRSRKALPHQHARRANSLNLHYGTIHHQASSSLSLDEQDEEPLHIIEQPSMPQTDFAERKQQQQQSQQGTTNDMRISFSSSDGSNGLGNMENSIQSNMIMSPPKFALVSSTNSAEQQPLQKPKRKNREGSLKKLSSEENLQKQNHTREDLVKNLSTQELQKELNDAVAARQNADDRIIAIEKLVKNLNVNATHPNDSKTMVTSLGFGGVNQSNVITITSSSMQQNSRSQTLSAAQASPSSSLQSNSTMYAPPKLSVVGPITDL